MPVLTPQPTAIGEFPAGAPTQASPRVAYAGFAEASAGLLRPGLLVRWSFYLSVFLIPFSRLYLPGTGDRLGVTRLVQVLLLCAVASQPRVCLRFVPTALLWFLGYAAFRIAEGIGLTPDLAGLWWPSTLEWLEFSLPWVWVMFNLLQFPRLPRAGLWALACGCALCALLHIAGIGEGSVGDGTDGRSTVFGENANVVGTTYAIALIAMVALAMMKTTPWSKRLVLYGMVGLAGGALAKTGSRTAALTLVLGVCLLLIRGRWHQSRTRRIATVVLLSLILGAIAWQIPTVVKRFEKVNASNLYEQEGRVRMMPVLIEIFLRSPIYGTGPDGYRMELTRRAMPYLLRDSRTIVSHNLVLLLLAETGLVGFGLFAPGVLLALRGAWRACPKPAGSLPLALLAPLVIGGAIVSNPTHDLIFWFATAYALAGAI